MINNIISPNIILSYIPSNLDLDTKPKNFQFGNGENQINYNVLSVLKSSATLIDNSQNDAEKKRFLAILQKELEKLMSANFLTDEEQSFIDIATKDPNGLASSILIVETTEETDDYSLLTGVPTDTYLKEMFHLDQMEFERRDLADFHERMDKISGNQAYSDLFNSMLGTSTKLSNFHLTDSEKLFNSRINSVFFD